MLRRHIALPADHGAWVFLFSPLLIGIFAGGIWTVATTYLFVGVLAAFLLRQPLSMVVKIFSGRRSRRDLPAAWFWSIGYSLITLLALTGLLLHGYQYIFILALPGILVFTWHLYLVSRRAERHQLGVELIGSGVLALTAPAAFWVGTGWPDPLGWWLFALVWLQSAASIVHAYMRLGQRSLPEIPNIPTRLQIGRRALIYTSFNLVVVTVFSLTTHLPALLPAAYLVQWVETVWGTLRPAVGFKPTAIGLRQLLVSSLFTIIFILTWTG